MQAPLDFLGASFSTGPAQFGVLDILRRAQGHVLGNLGLDPHESPYSIIASGPFWRLREYSDGGSKRLLIVAAPIKQPYIWDLSPSASAIRECLGHDLHIYLLEWLPASEATGNNGLAEYAKALGECVAKISDGDVAARPFVAGHSLGGTLAAIFAAMAPASIPGLILLCAPLCFRPATSRFRDVLISLVPSDVGKAQPFPGSVLTHVSTLASPDTFLWSRMMDAALSLGESEALETHARVERWALDEAALPGRLVHQIVDWLYRGDHFSRGDLKIDGKPVGPQSASVPTLAVVNTSDDIAPLESVRPFIEAMASRDSQIIEYPGELGVGLQHLGILVGRKAHAQVWPQIFSWIESKQISPGRTRPG